MATTKFITAQGNVATGGGGIIYQPSSGYEGTVHNLSFANSSNAAYILNVYIRRQASVSNILLYRLVLSAGDMVDDGNTYELDEGDYLYASSSVANTNYNVSGVEIIKTIEPL